MTSGVNILPSILSISFDSGIIKSIQHSHWYFSFKKIRYFVRISDPRLNIFNKERSPRLFKDLFEPNRLIINKKIQLRSDPKLKKHIRTNRQQLQQNELKTCSNTKT